MLDKLKILNNNVQIFKSEKLFITSREIGGGNKYGHQQAIFYSLIPETIKPNGHEIIRSFELIYEISPFDLREIFYSEKWVRIVNLSKIDGILNRHLSGEFCYLSEDNANLFFSYSRDRKLVLINLHKSKIKGQSDVKKWKFFVNTEFRVNCKSEFMYRPGTKLFM